MCDCQAEALASFLFGIVAMVAFLVWYGQRRK